MPVDIRDIPFTLSYDKVYTKKRLIDLKKFPKKRDTSALALIAKYLHSN
jgi:hypothetical protein